MALDPNDLQAAWDEAGQEPDLQSAWDEAGATPAPAAAPVQEKGFFERNFVDPFMRGKIQTLDPALATLGFYNGSGTAEDWADALIAAEDAAKAYELSPEMQGIRQKFADSFNPQGDSPGGFGGFARTVADNPVEFSRMLGDMFVESVPAMGVTLGTAGAGAAGGAGIGAAGGSVVPGLGTAAGAAAGATGGGIAGTFAGSTALELTGTFNDVIKEELQARGLPLTRENLLAAARDANVFRRAADIAQKKGITVGAFDALSFGIAGKVGKPVEGALDTLAKLSLKSGGGAGRRMAGAAAEVGAQATLGSVGEAASQVAAKGKVYEPLGVVAEGAIEAGGAPVEIGVAGLTRPKVDANPQAPAEVSPDEVQAAWDETKTPEGSAAAQGPQPVQAQAPQVPPLDPPVEVSTPPEPKEAQPDPALVAGQLRAIAVDPNLTPEEKVAKTREVMALDTQPFGQPNPSPVGGNTPLDRGASNPTPLPQPLDTNKPVDPKAVDKRIAADAPPQPRRTIAPNLQAQQGMRIDPNADVPMGESPAPADIRSASGSRYDYTQEQVAQVKAMSDADILQAARVFDTLNAKGDLREAERVQLDNARRVVTIAQDPSVGRLSWNEANPGQRRWTAGKKSQVVDTTPAPSPAKATTIQDNSPRPELPAQEPPRQFGALTPAERAAREGAPSRPVPLTQGQTRNRLNNILGTGQPDTSPPFGSQKKADIVAKNQSAQRTNLTNSIASYDQAIAQLEQEVAKAPEGTKRLSLRERLRSAKDTRDRLQKSLDALPPEAAAEPQAQPEAAPTPQEQSDAIVNQPGNSVPADQAAPGAPDTKAVADNLARRAGETENAPPAAETKAAQKARDIAVNEKVRQTYTHPELGQIDLLEGNSKFGHEHIIQRHGAREWPNLDNIPNMTVTDRTPDGRYVTLSDGNNVVVVATDLAGKPGNHIITAYNADPKKTRALQIARELETLNDPNAGAFAAGIRARVRDGTDLKQSEMDFYEKRLADMKSQIAAGPTTYDEASDFTAESQLPAKNWDMLQDIAELEPAVQALVDRVTAELQRLVGEINKLGFPAFKENGIAGPKAVQGLRSELTDLRVAWDDYVKKLIAMRRNYKRADPAKLDAAEQELMRVLGETPPPADTGPLMDSTGDGAPKKRGTLAERRAAKTEATTAQMRAENEAKKSGVKAAQAKAKAARDKAAAKAAMTPEERAKKDRQNEWQKIKRRAEARTRDMKAFTEAFGSSDAMALALEAHRKLKRKRELPIEEEQRAYDMFRDMVGLFLDEMDAMGDPKPGVLMDMDTSEDPFADIDEQPDSGQVGALEDEKNPPGSLSPTFRDYALAKGLSPRERALRDAFGGLEPDEVRVKPVAEQVEAVRQLLQKTFGFTQVGVPRGTNMRSALDAMLDAYVNLQWMAHTLGLPLSSLGLNKTLTLTLSGGKTSRYFGAFYPAQKLIDIKVAMQGADGRANAFGHEWFHALDNYLLGFLTPGGVTNLLSMFAKREGIPPGMKGGGPRLAAAFVQLLHRVYFDDAAFAAKVLELQNAASKTDAQGNPTKGALEAQRKLDELLDGSGKVQIKASDYAEKAKNFQKGGAGYWANPAEMLARAFEAYLGHRITAAGGDTAFVSKPDQAYLDNVDKRLRETFPKDQERALIFAAFDELFSELNAMSMFGTDGPAAAPDNSDFYDTQVFNKQAALIAEPSIWALIKSEVGQYRNAMVRMFNSRTRGQELATAGQNIKERAGMGGERPTNDRFNIFKRAGDAVLTLFVPTDLHMKGRAMDKGNAGARPYLLRLLSYIAADPGTGNYAAETFEGEVRRVLNQTASKLESALKVFGFSDNKRPDGAAKERIRDLLLGKTVPEATAQEKGIAAAMRRIYDELYYVARNAGVQMGYVFRTGYQPRYLNRTMVFADPGKFEAAATKVYEILFDQEAGLLKDAEQAFEEMAKKMSYIQNRVQDMYQAALPAYKQMMKERSRILREMRGVKGEIALAKSDLERAVQAKDARGVAAAQAQIRAAEAKMRRLDGEMNRLADRLVEHVRPYWSQAAARSWSEHIQLGDNGHFDSNGIDADFAKPRTLPDEADDLLSEFYINDPFESLSHYTADVARKTAYLKRFGAHSSVKGATTDLSVLLGTDKDVQAAVKSNPTRYDVSTPEGKMRIIEELTDPVKHNRMEMMLREAMRAGAIPEDLQTYRDRIEHITSGLTAGPARNELRRVTTAIYLVGTLSLMGRVVWTSLTEPLVVYMRTKSVRATAATLAAYIGQAVRTSSAQDRATFSRAMGLVVSSFSEGMIMQQMAGTYGDSPQVQTLLSNYYRNAAWLTPLTNAQRNAVLAGSVVYFKELGRNLKSKNKVTAQLARGELRELGIPEQHVDAFGSWMQTAGDLPALDDLTTPAGELFMIAANRFNTQVVQGGGRVTKPVLATTPWGRVMFQLLSFGYDFMRNVHVRLYNQGVQEAGIRQQLGQGKAMSRLSATGNVTANAALGFGLIFIGQLGATMLREAIFNADKWEELEKKGEADEWLLGLALSRMGLFGPVDTVVQAVTSLRYQRDLTGMVAGPSLGYMLDAAQSLLNVAFGRNSENTKTAERKAAQAVYGLTVVPALGVGAAILPGGPLGAAVGGFIYQKAGSAQVQKDVAAGVVGYTPSEREKMQK